MVGVINGVQLTGARAAPQDGQGGQIDPRQGHRIPNQTPAGAPARRAENLFQRPALNF